jgi:hypothetical protein
VKTFRLRVTCPHCGRYNDRASGPKGEKVNIGDVLICLGCGEAGILESRRRWRAFTLQERIEAGRLEDYRDMMGALRAAKDGTP